MGQRAFTIPLDARSPGGHAERSGPVHTHLGRRHEDGQVTVCRDYQVATCQLTVPAEARTEKSELPSAPESSYIWPLTIKGSGKSSEPKFFVQTFCHFGPTWSG
jgi:hypothetical protein